MRQWWLLAPVVAAAIVWTACSSFGKDESTQTLDAAANQDATATDATDATAEDAGSFDARVPVDGALVDDGFEVGSSCDGWMPQNGATASPVDGGRTGLRACEVCAFGAADYIHKTVAVPPEAGRYPMTVWVKAVAGDGGPSANVTLSLTYPDAGVAGYGSNNRVPTFDWLPLQTVVTAPAGATSARLNIGVGGAVGCVHIDDVVFTKE